MRHTEFWARMERSLGPEYSTSWAELTAIGALGSRTVREALDAGVEPKVIWAAVHEQLGLPASEK